MADTVELIAGEWTTRHDDRVTVYSGADGQFRWRVRARNGEIVGSGEAHPALTDAWDAARRHHPPSTELVDFQIPDDRWKRAELLVQQLLRSASLPVEPWMVRITARALAEEAERD